MWPARVRGAGVRARILAAVPTSGILARAIDAVPPASGAVVMGTGIVSVALLLDNFRTLSLILLVIAAVIWLALACLLPLRALGGARQFEVDIAHPTSLTSIAGTSVLGTRLTLLGWDWAGAVLLVVAVGIWLFLVPVVLRNWRTPTIGASFILTVATESLALLAAALADADDSPWLLYAALFPLFLGVVFYLFVLVRFDFRQLLVGAGDHWVTGGALAITTVTAGRLVLADIHTGTLPDVQGTLKTIALILWILTMLWLPALVIAEVVRWRPHYNVRRWSTVFPVGMYAAASFVVGEVTHTPAITDFAHVWLWVAVLVWLRIFASMLWRAPSLVRASR
jgi:tellurite resistance protein TehA-like permease